MLSCETWEGLNLGGIGLVDRCLLLAYGDSKCVVPYLRICRV